MNTENLDQAIASLDRTLTNEQSMGVETYSAFMDVLSALQDISDALKRVASSVGFNELGETMHIPPCPTCEEPTTVTMMGSQTTLLGGRAWFRDVNGTVHHHDPNTTTTIYGCSGCGQFVYKAKAPCPAEHCNYNE